MRKAKVQKSRQLANDVSLIEKINQMTRLKKKTNGDNCTTWLLQCMDYLHIASYFKFICT